jgi:cell wall-active antibiotic response 4TMS protein YvqF
MNCFNHSEVPAVAFCRNCGKGLCADCRRVAQGTVFCEEHVPAVAASTVARPAPSPVLADTSPALAFLLGLIPGVGAIYNGQYAKGLVHAIIFGLLVSIISSGSADGMEPMFGTLIAAWYIYMPLEAYHTARKRRAGEPVDEFSSIVNLRGAHSRFPVGAVVLIALGVLLLLNTLDVIHFRHMIRFWPVILILAGGYMLYTRMQAADAPQAEVTHEQQ